MTVQREDITGVHSPTLETVVASGLDDFYSTSSEILLQSLILVIVLMPSLSPPFLMPALSHPFLVPSLSPHFLTPLAILLFLLHSATAPIFALQETRSLLPDLDHDHDQLGRPSYDDRENRRRWGRRASHTHVHHRAALADQPGRHRRRMTAGPFLEIGPPPRERDGIPGAEKNVLVWDPGFGSCRSLRECKGSTRTWLRCLRGRPVASRD